MVFAKGPCPPEDCGGPFGYADLLDAYGDPDHEGNHDALEILGTPPVKAVLSGRGLGWMLHS